MISNRWTVLLGSALVLGALGCGPEPGHEAPGEPSGLAGKGDTVTLVSGAGIASSHVDPARYYLSHRSIDSLAAVGAIAGAMESVARRVDGIIASQPANDEISIVEMVRMEQPAYIATLFPEERAAFATLWKLLEMPDQPPSVLQAPAGIDLSISDTSVGPAALAFAPSEAIDSLPAQLRLPARRLQLVYDSDGDADTVSFDDLTQGESDAYGRFTPADVVAFGKIRDELWARGTSEAEARLTVPAPGDTVGELTVGGGQAWALTLRLTRSVRYEEQRRITPGDYSGSWRLRLAMHHEAALTSHLADGRQALLIDEATGAERVLADTGVIDALAAGTYLVEIWNGGQREATARATLPGLEGGEGRVDLDGYVDHALYSHAGDPLVRNPVEGRYNYNPYVGSPSYYWVRFSYDLTAVAPAPGAVESRALTEVATPSLGVPAGRYELSAGNGIGTFYVDVYPGGVAYTVRQGVRRRLRPTQLDYDKKLDSGFAEGLHRVVYNPSTRELWTHSVDGTAADLRVTLTPLLRI